MLFLKKKAPARNAPVVVRARSAENRRMLLPNIEETPRSTLRKQILMKWVYHKGETKSRFYHENFDPTGKYYCKSTFLLKTLKRVLFRTVFFYRVVWSKHERGVRFQTKNLLISDVYFCRKSMISRFWMKTRSNSKDEMMDNDARH